jgi:transcriptional regulator with XRE-family HTH domain
VQKYEKGANRIGASRLQTISQVLEAPIGYFFPLEPAAAGGMGENAQSDYISDFMMSSEGIELNRAFVQIKDPKLRRKVIDLVRVMASTETS